MSRHEWTNYELETLRICYAHTPTNELADILEIDIRKVYAKANKLGLKKSKQFLSGTYSGRINKGETIGFNTQFKKGHQPWNKGMKGLPSVGRMSETQFKTGQRGSKWVPIGSERLTKDGYLQRKINATGYPPRDWKGVHIILWEEHNGPIPDKHAVVFKDGNKTNIVIENLELISRKELMRRNTIHRYPDELKQTIKAARKLQRTIKEIENGKK